MVRGDFDSLHDSNFQDKKSRQDINQRRNFQSFTNPLPHKNSSLVLNADSTREASAYNNTKNRRKGTKHGFDGMRYDSASNPSDHYEKNNLVVKQTNSLLHGYENNSLKNVQRGEYVKSKPSNLPQILQVPRTCHCGDANIPKLCRARQFQLHQVLVPCAEAQLLGSREPPRPVPNIPTGISLERVTSGQCGEVHERNKSSMMKTDNYSALSDR
ncbi:hypothetical protein JHK82_035660 [Glycine max]|nr:hypothetical protein JHK85_036385 [Glycine max]KAG4976319.1 hypothetical protein JHK86_035793 [Glycine max]KAG5112391.1 hypothetical protein JHK82_035660 [Glycine max]